MTFNRIAKAAGRGLARYAAASAVALVFIGVAAQPATAAPCIKFPPHGPIVAPPPAGVSITCNTATDRFNPFGPVISITTAPGFIRLDNSGDLAGATGIFTNAVLGNTIIRNSGDIAAAGLGSFGISALTGIGDLFIDNRGDIASAALGTIGISAVTGTGDLRLGNSGHIATAGLGVIGISAVTGIGDLNLTNNGDVAVAGLGVIGISAVAGLGELRLSNSGDIAARGDGAFGIFATAASDVVAIGNQGDISVKGDDVTAIRASSGGTLLSIISAGNLTARGQSAAGIDGTTAAAQLFIFNAGTLNIKGASALGISAETDSGGISLENTGDVDVTGNAAAGIMAASSSGNIDVLNSGKVTASEIGLDLNTGGAIRVTNSGALSGGQGAILALAGGRLDIDNSGSISAGNNLAIFGIGPAIDVTNRGVITGSVELLGQTTFANKRGGLFEAFDSDFGFGVFANEEGATVHTARNPLVAETTSFFGLRSFANAGLLSLVDGGTGDVFELSDCGCVRPSFSGQGSSTIALDVFLGGPGSPADNVLIDGDVKGKTAVEVHNTNPGSGTTNTQGIPIVFVDGAVKSNQFYLKGGPIDAGFVAYDLFFVKTGSGFFELRTIPAHEGSFLLPELTTASQDVFFSTTETWFDRTADLRVLLHGGGPGVASGAGAEGGLPVAPGFWARAGGNWLNVEDSAGAVAYGRSYQFDLERDMQIMDLEIGIDFGKRQLFSAHDLLIFGLLGGVIHADLDYQSVERLFTYEGGEIGAYATYLNGGLFVDALIKADFLQLDAGDAPGFPSDLNDTNIGGRVDAGYRFGGFRGGPFIEPLATIAVVDATVDSFSLNGNSVSFEDDPNVRGRLGLRLGTSMAVWDGATFEPFVVGSLWGTLSGTNSATLTSFGTTYPTFSDEAPDAWGQVSAGFNLFNPGASTSVFAKLDVNVGEEITGVGGRAGMRLAW
ncbi:MAG TPA: autotransporter outer membrane beta-barrel domain-containing protein [Methyloceanibacter sp.]|nr:autotransporter outer membrane beta-barrel domain-containing protein [Methyloceanibacter sp.]